MSEKRKQEIVMPDQQITVGIPKAMLYHRYRALWKLFFTKLGVNLVYSPDTNRKILEEGEDVANSEACLSMKIFMGHVNYLIGKCDYILVPRISNFGIRRVMCTRFSALYDICCNTFRESGQKFLAYNVDYQHHIDEEDAFVRMAKELGYSWRDATKAYKSARKEFDTYRKEQIKKEEKKYQSKRFKILLAAHSYVLNDPYVGKPVTDMLRSMDCTVIRADLADPKKCRKLSADFSKTLKWEMSREIVGGIEMHKKDVDGIVLLSAFPCAPDAMVNDMIMRRNQQHKIPILHMTVDAQSGTAGIETRLESFVDIIRLQGEKNGKR